MDDLKTIEKNTRYEINRLLSLNNNDKSIGIFIASSSNKIPKGALDVSVDEIKFVNKSPVLDGGIFIVKGHQNGNMVDMVRLQNHITENNPHSIYFVGFQQKSIWVIFQFYNELMKNGDKKAKGSILDTLKDSKLNFKIDENYELFTLGTILGANIFLNAIQTESDTFPEATLTKILVQRNITSNHIPYMVIPRADNNFVPPITPAIMIDGTDGTIKTYKKSSFGFKKQKEIDFNFMQAAIYFNFILLYKEMKKPRLVIFKNVEPSAVFGMINFYEQIVDPKTEKIINIYSYLNDETISYVTRQWNSLANWSGAKPFESVIRIHL